MSEKSFHDNYVAPLIVTFLSSAVLAALAYFFSQSSSIGSPLRSDAVVSQSETAVMKSNQRVPAFEYPSDGGTNSILRDFMANATTALEKYQGKEVKITSCIALVSSPDVLDLYGVPEKNRVEGIYFKCRLSNDQATQNTLRSMQLISIKGTVSGYHYHPNSPYILLDSCSLVR